MRNSAVVDRLHRAQAFHGSNFTGKACHRECNLEVLRFRQCKCARDAFLYDVRKETAVESAKHRSDRSMAVEL